MSVRPHAIKVVLAGENYTVEVKFPWDDWLNRGCGTRSFDHPASRAPRCGGKYTTFKLDRNNILFVLVIEMVGYNPYTYVTHILFPVKPTKTFILMKIVALSCQINVFASSVVYNSNTHPKIVSFTNVKGIYEKKIFEIKLRRT